MIEINIIITIIGLYLIGVILTIIFFAINDSRTLGNYSDVDVAGTIFAAFLWPVFLIGCILSSLYNVVFKLSKTRMAKKRARDSGRS